MKKKFIRWMEDNRGLILTVFGLPLSFIFDLVMQVYKVAIAKKLGSSKYEGSNLIMRHDNDIPVPELVLPRVPLQPRQTRGEGGRHPATGRSNVESVGNGVAMLMLANMFPLWQQCPLMVPLSPEESQHETIVAAVHIIAKDTAT